MLKSMIFSITLVCCCLNVFAGGGTDAIDGVGYVPSTQKEFGSELNNSLDQKINEIVSLYDAHTSKEVKLINPDGCFQAILNNSSDLSQKCNMIVLK